MFATTGMRRGELLGLRWTDVDLDTARIAIRSNRVRAGKSVATGTPKTKRGTRRLVLDPDTIAALRAWRKRQLEERMLIGSRYTDSGLVFTYRMAHRSCRTGSASGSGVTSGEPGCPRSASMTPPLLCHGRVGRRSSRQGRLGTPRPRQRSDHTPTFRPQWICTNTSCLKWTRPPPPRSQRLSGGRGA
jgi:hypothetical protein